MIMKCHFRAFLISWNIWSDLKLDRIIGIGNDTKNVKGIRKPIVIPIIIVWGTQTSISMKTIKANVNIYKKNNSFR